MQVALFIFAIVLFIGLVIVHELGHFLVARRNGVEAEEFGIGFPPQIVGRKLSSGLTLSLNWLPLGGFVRLKGENDSDSRKGSFGAASVWSKTKILLAGVMANLVAGLILLTLLAIIGMPVLISRDFNGVDQFTVSSDTKVTTQEVEAGYVLPGSPASQIGLTSTDTILKIASAGQVRNIKTPDQLRNATKAFAGQKVAITYRHNGQELTKTTKLLSASEVQASLKTNDPKGFLGVDPNPLTIQRSTWSAPIVAVGFTWQLIDLTLKGIGHAIGGLGSTIAGLVTGNHAAQQNGQTQAEGQVGGPVAVMKILWSSGSLGINFVLAIIAIISVTLALINVLPIPALDGGRLALVLLARGILKRPLSQSTEAAIVGIGYAVLMALMILITIVDVKR